jgi:hypothetical protein
VSAGLEIAAVSPRDSEESYFVVTSAADPAAGAEVSVIVPGGRVWEIQTVFLSLVTDATAANRFLHLALDDGTTIFWRGHSNTAHTASTTAYYTWSATGAPVATLSTGFMLTLPTPPLVLHPGFRIRTITPNLQAGDNYARPVLYVREHVHRGRGADLAAEMARLSERLGRMYPDYREGE